MNVNVEKLSENQVKIAIQLDASEFQGAIKQAFDKVVKNVKIDGFRQERYLLIFILAALAMNHYMKKQ